MKKSELFPWPMEEGAAADYADGTLILAIKDEEWNDNQLLAADSDFELVVCETNGLIIFLLEGGPLDTCDFYFNIQDCEEQAALLHEKNLHIQAVLLDKNNVIQALKSTTLSGQETGRLLSLLQKQKETDFMPGEYEVNVEGMQAAFEPAELARYEKMRCTLK